MKSVPWVHGNRFILGTVVEVRQAVYRGSRARGNWTARIDLKSGVMIQTDGTHQTQEDAEQSISKAIHDYVDPFIGKPTE